MSHRDARTDLPNDIRFSKPATGLRQILLERHARATHLVFVSDDGLHRVGPQPSELEDVALFLAGHARDAADGRDLLETCGLIKPEAKR